jgi:hypothetical protein
MLDQEPDPETSPIRQNSSNHNKEIFQAEKLMILDFEGFSFMEISILPPIPTKYFQNKKNSLPTL